MPAGPKISDKVRGIIAEEALKNPHLQRKEVIELIEKKLEEKGLRVPAFTTLVRLISQVRQVSAEDRPWSFTSDEGKEKIPYELLGIIIKLQRWCLIMENPLTVREAKWASRLVNVVDNPKHLLERAWRYSIRERIKSTFDDLDMDLCLPRYSPVGDSKKRVADKLGITHYLTSDDLELETPIWIERSMDTSIDQAMETKVLGNSLEHTKELSEDLQEIYALWLRYFARSTGWNTADQDTRVSLAEELHSEVAKYGTSGESKKNGNWKPSDDLLSKLNIENQ